MFQSPNSTSLLSAIRECDNSYEFVLPSNIVELLESQTISNKIMAYHLVTNYVNGLTMDKKQALRSQLMSVMLNDFCHSDSQVRLEALSLFLFLSGHYMTKDTIALLEEGFNDISSNVRKKAAISLCNVCKNFQTLHFSLGVIKPLKVQHANYVLLQENYVKKLKSLVQERDVDESFVSLMALIMLSFSHDLITFEKPNESVVMLEEWIETRVKELLDSLESDSPQLFYIVCLLGESKFVKNPFIEFMLNILQNSFSPPSLIAVTNFLVIHADIWKSEHQTKIPEVIEKLLFLADFIEPSEAIAVYETASKLVNISSGVAIDCWSQLLYDSQNPTFIVKEKLLLLKLLAGECKEERIVEIIRDYVFSSNNEIIELVIDTIVLFLKKGKFKSKSEEVLTSLLTSGNDFIFSCVLSSLPGLIQILSLQEVNIINQLPSTVPCLNAYPKGQCGGLYIIGLYAEQLPGCVKTMESMLSNFSRPLEMKNVIFHLLDKLIPQDVSCDVRRKGEIYRLLLQQDVDMAHFVIDTAHSIESSVESQEA